MTLIDDLTKASTPAVEFDGYELHGARIDRVDLVGKAANGRSFLLIKAQDSNTLMSADDVRELLKQAEGADMAKKTEQPAEPVSKAEDLDVTEPLASPNSGADAIGEDTPSSPGWEAVDAATAEKWVAVLARAKNAVELLSSREQIEVASGDGDIDDEFNSWDLDDAAGAIDFAISMVGGYAARESAEVGISEDMENVGKALMAIDVPAFDAMLTAVERGGALAKAGRVLSQSNEAEIRTAADSLQKVLSTLPSAPIADETTGEITKTDEEGTEVAKTNTDHGAGLDTAIIADQVAKADDDDKPKEDAIGEDVEKTEPEAPTVEALAKMESTERDAVLKAWANARAKAEPLGGDGSGKALDLTKTEFVGLADLDAPTVYLLTKSATDETAAELLKADAMTAVFDQNGKLIGAVKPSAIVPLDGGAAATDDTKPDDPAAPTDPAAPAPAPAAAPAAPAAAPVAKSETETVTLKKSDIDSIVESAIAKAVAPRDDAIADLTKEVEWLKQPAKSRVALNGAALTKAPRGQDEITKADDTSAVSKSAETLQAALKKADTPAEREAIEKELQDMAAEALTDLHKSRRG